MSDEAGAPPAIEGYARYAIYYAPAETEPLGVFGEGWFGRSARGEARSTRGLQAIDPGFGAEALAPLVAGPRRYGLHGTLKAPFALAPGVTAAALDAALARDAARRPAASAPPLRLSMGLGFLSLRPAGPSPAINALAAGIVAAFARFGAPPDAATLAKRRAAGLSRRQEAYLAAYGYPYVLEEFRFHVTLAAAPAEQDAPPLCAALEAKASPLRPVLDAPRFAISELCLFGDPGDGAPFRLLRRHALAPAR
ncbi:MAG: DUF1045 domain-containing protein [Pseudomonadota bacterium]